MGEEANIKKLKSIIANANADLLTIYKERNKLNNKRPFPVKDSFRIIWVNTGEELTLIKCHEYDNIKVYKDFKGNIHLFFVDENSYVYKMEVFRGSFYWDEEKASYVDSGGLFTHQFSVFY